MLRVLFPCNKCCLRCSYSCQFISLVVGCEHDHRQVLLILVRSFQRRFGRPCILAELPAANVTARIAKCFDVVSSMSEVSQPSSKPVRSFGQQHHPAGRSLRQRIHCTRSHRGSRGYHFRSTRSASATLQEHRWLSC